MILALIPIKKNISKAIKDIADELAAQLQQDLKSLIQVVMDDRGSGDAHVTDLESRVRHTAAIRQSIVDSHLKKHHSHVLWIDADIIRYTSAVAASIYNTSNLFKAIVAPKVMLDKHGDRFYDIAGFIDRGNKANLYPPYFRDTKNRFVHLDSVGCFYIIPADIYRAGAIHQYHPDHPTDHMGICQFGRRHGFEILCDTTLSVYHAWLPDFGEAPH